MPTKINRLLNSWKLFCQIRRTVSPARMAAHSSAMPPRKALSRYSPAFAPSARRNRYRLASQKASSSTQVAASGSRVNERDVRPIS